MNMATVSRTRLTAAEYLERERAAETRNEFRDGEIIPMVGGTREHNLIETNLLRLLANALYDKNYEIYPGNMRVKVDETGLYTHPDLAVVQGEPQLEDDHFDTLQNPIAIFEILLPSTESYDRGEKFAHYRALESLVEYTLVAQDKMRVERFTRQDGGEWLFRDYNAGVETIDFAALECSLALAEIYRKVPLSDSPKT